MTILIRTRNDGRYTTKIRGAEAIWDNREEKKSTLILYGTFPAPNCQFANKYIMHFRTDIAFSLCKKLEKEGTADLSTDYIKNYIIGVEYADEVL